MNHPSHALIALTTLAGLLVSGCSGPATDDTSEPAIPDNPPPLTSITQMNPPLLDYAVSAQEAATVENAQALIAATCAARFGLTYAPDLTVRARSTSADIATRYGPIDPAWVAVNGYTPQSPDFSDGAPWDPSPELLEVLYGEDEEGNPVQRKDLEGNPLHEGGCYGEAEKQLFVERPFYGPLERLTDDGLSYSYDRMATDSRVVQAQNDWVACMNTRGYSGDSYFGLSDANATREEPSEMVKLAKDDVACAQQVNLPGISYAVDSAYQERWLEEHGAELKTLRDGFEAGLERAKEVLSNR